ncbi:MAG TPA: electron transport complex subunit RsxA [Clostridiales bacterium]|jgi:electron transport complex protein RnfA|nr:electron transport complex subunit RsxA [Clostridiales bacterium]
MNISVNIFTLFITCVLTNNVIFSRFLGNCPFLGVSGKVETAFGMGMAVTFVMAISSLCTWLVYAFLLVPLGLQYLNTIAFILIIAALVQVVEMFIKKSSPTLYKSLGIYLPLITTNCAVLGIAILNINSNYNLLTSVLNGTFSALGFMLAIVLMAGVRERLEHSDIPKCMRGFSSSLVIAGLMALAFMGFSGIAQ